jgi:hypothetical protein
MSVDYEEIPWPWAVLVGSRKEPEKGGKGVYGLYGRTTGEGPGGTC